MMIIIAIFLPVLYFLIKRRWIGFWLSALAMAYSLAMLTTVVLAPVMAILWAVAAGAAVLDQVYGTADREDEKHHKSPEKHEG